MKILGWMHRKFRQNSNEPKHHAIGNSCTCLIGGHPSADDDQKYCSKPNHCTKHLSKIRGENQHLSNSFASLEAGRSEEEFGEESPASFSELFHGFLAIGTLGTDPAMNDPSTPTFAYSVDTIMEKETEVTETELQLINDELEKVLEQDVGNDSSGRNSHVSMGRSSHGSTITLSGKQLEDTGNGTIVCPLQGYLLSSAIGLPETAMSKKENRTSLGELLQKTKMTEDVGAKCDKTENKESDKSAVNLMKKLLKRKILHTSSRTSTTTTQGTADSTSAETRIPKILQMFHRKVHPEFTVATDKFDDKRKNKWMSNNYEEWMDTGEDITLFPQRSPMGNGARHVKSHSNPPLGPSDSSENSEYWIKTDADYLVLEL